MNSKEMDFGEVLIGVDVRNGEVLCRLSFFDGIISRIIFYGFWVILGL